MSLAKNKVWGGCERRKSNAKDNALKILIGTAAVVLTIVLLIISKRIKNDN